MNWTIRSGAGGIVSKIAVAGAVVAAPILSLGGPAVAATEFGRTPTVLPAPRPADPPTLEPAPPAPHGEYYNPGDANDWWYNGSADGGGGGGG